MNPCSELSTITIVEIHITSSYDRLTIRGSSYSGFFLDGLQSNKKYNRSYRRSRIECMDTVIDDPVGSFVLDDVCVCVK